MDELKKIEQDILKDKITTAVSKVKLINEIKTTLGEEMKKNPSGVKIKKKTPWNKFSESFKKLFTKF
jgi:hypothetical protein